MSHKSNISNSRQLGAARAYWAWRMKNEGLSFSDIREVMNLSGQDKARTLVARGRKMNEKGGG